MQATGVLYQSLYEQIAQISWPSRISRDKAIAFVQSFLRKRNMENTSPTEYTDMAYVYFLQKLGSKYRQIIKPLIDAGVLQSTGYYRPGWYNEEAQYVKGQCLSYRINPELLDDQVVKVIYQGDKKRQKCRDEVTMRSKQIMRQIRIPDMSSRELIQFVKRSLTDDRVRKMIKINSPDGSICEITDETIYLKSGGSDELEMMNDECRAHAGKYVKVADLQLRTKFLIKDGKHYYIEHLDTYIKRKRRHLTQAYCDQLLRIKHRNVYADRNETNLRLDSNLTNLKSGYLSLLQLDGQRLSQIDLKNSQFRFFVMLLEQCERQTLFGAQGQQTLFSKLKGSQTAKSEFQVRLKGGKEIEGKPVTLLSILFDKYCTEKQGLKRSLTADYKRFRKLVKTGELYEYIQKIYWAETGTQITRKEAKKLMFTVAFSSYRYCPEGKHILRKHLPSIISVIDGYKKEMIRAYAREEASGEYRVSSETLCPADISQAARDRGNASFAVMLQQVESVIFVDKILAECHRRGLKVLSKHDSIVCRACDKKFVTSLVLRTLNSIFGKATYSLDIDGEVFRILKRKKSRLHRVATEVVHTLFGVAYQSNAPPTSVASGEYRIASVGVTSSECRVASTEEPAHSRTSTLLADEKIRSERVRRLRDRIMGR